MTDLITYNHRSYYNTFTQRAIWQKWYISTIVILVKENSLGYLKNMMCMDVIFHGRWLRKWPLRRTDGWVDSVLYLMYVCADVNLLYLLLFDVYSTNNDYLDGVVDLLN